MHSQSGFEQTNPRHDARLTGKTVLAPVSKRPWGKAILYALVAFAPVWFGLAIILAMGAK